MSEDYSPSEFRNSMSPIPADHFTSQHSLNPFNLEPFELFQPGTLLHSLTNKIEALQVVEHALDRIQTRTQHKLRFNSLCSIIPGYVVEQQCSQMVEICRLLETERDQGEFTLDDKDPEEPKRPEVERLISLQLEQKNKEELIMIDADFRNTETFKSATQLRELRKEAEVRDSVKKK